jgi:hypothetical protein
LTKKLIIIYKVKKNKELKFIKSWIRLDNPKILLEISFLNKSGIYAFKCLITEAFYIGSAKNLGKRFLMHLKNTNSNIR